jgi:hypothetical protein
MLVLELTVFFVWAIVTLRNSYKSEKESMRWELYWIRKGE